VDVRPKGFRDLVNDVMKRFVDVGSNFGKRLEDVGSNLENRFGDHSKRLYDFASRMLSHERTHIFLFGTVVGPFGGTFKYFVDLNDKLES
jgi:hypothetical protein